MQVEKLDNIKAISEFVKLPYAIYRNNGLFVPPLIRSEKNKIKDLISNIGEGYEAALWLLKENKKYIGRIAAIFQNTKPDQAKLAYFDCINNLASASILLKQAEEWAKDKGTKEIQGPLGLTSFDKAGILVQGFDEIPTNYSNYNEAYYQQLFEHNGYVKKFDWVEYLIKLPDSVPEKIEKGSKLVKARYGISLIEANNITEIAKFKDEIRTLINVSYKNLNGFVQLSQSKFDEIFTQFSSILVPALIPMVKNNKGELIGFGLALPSFSKALIKTGGRLSPFGWFYLSAAKWNATIADLLIIVVKPEYQKKGVHALIFEKMLKSLSKKGIKYVESTRELEDNKHVQNLWQGFEFRQHKRSRCYSKELC